MCVLNWSFANASQYMFLMWVLDWSFANTSQDIFLIQVLHWSCAAANQYIFLMWVLNWRFAHAARYIFLSRVLIWSCANTKILMGGSGSKGMFYAWNAGARGIVIVRRSPVADVSVTGAFQVKSNILCGYILLGIPRQLRSTLLQCRKRQAQPLPKHCRNKFGSFAWSLAFPAHTIKLWTCSSTVGRCHQWAGCSGAKLL